MNQQPERLEMMSQKHARGRALKEHSKWGPGFGVNWLDSQSTCNVRFSNFESCKRNGAVSMKWRWAVRSGPSANSNSFGQYGLGRGPRKPGRGRANPNIKHKVVGVGTESRPATQGATVGRIDEPFSSAFVAVPEKPSSSGKEDSGLETDLGGAPNRDGGDDFFKSRMDPQRDSESGGRKAKVESANKRDELGVWKPSVSMVVKATQEFRRIGRGLRIDKK